MPSWTTPVDHVTGYTVTASDWDNFFGANGDIAYLYGDTGWTAVVGGVGFVNSWANQAGYTTRFRKIGTRVQMQGSITTGTINTTAFTLPVGYRPSQNTALASVNTSNGASCAIAISTAGAVNPYAGSTPVQLDVSFDTL